MVENQTAAIGELLEKIIADATDGAVTVKRGAIQSAATFAGLYESRGRGNSRFKSPLESHHNLKHNEFASLPGQMGKDRDNSPEELHGRDRHNTALLKACAALPAESAAALMLPFIPWTAFMQIWAFVVDRMNNRKEHHLEGWEECGFVVNEFRMKVGEHFCDWLPMAQLAALPPHEKMAVEAVIGQPGYVRCRKMSPQEVWDAQSGELVRIRPQYVPAILGPDLAVEAARNNAAVFAGAPVTAAEFERESAIRRANLPAAALLDEEEGEAEGCRLEAEGSGQEELSAEALL